MRLFALAGMLLVAACAPPSADDTAGGVQANVQSKGDTAQSLPTLRMTGKNAGYSDIDLSITATSADTYDVSGKNFAYDMGYTIAREWDGFHARGEIVGYDVSIVVWDQPGASWRLYGQSGGYDFDLRVVPQADGSYRVTGENNSYDTDLTIAGSGDRYTVRGHNISYSTSLTITGSGLDHSRLPVPVLLALGTCVGVK